MYKKLLIFLIALFSSLMISNKIDAMNVSQCNYGNGNNFILPVTIGVEVEGIDTMYPFDNNKKIHQKYEMLIHDASSCNAAIPTPNIDTKKYFVAIQYYYKYNNSIVYSSTPLIYGSFHNIDLVAPTITSFTPERITTVEKYLSLDNISTYVTAKDDIDGNIIPEVIYDNYSENYNKIGIYSIIFQACDKSNNCSKLQIQIKVIDDIPPIIEGKTAFTSYLSNPLNMNNITLSLKAIDKYDGDVSDTIYIKKNNYNPLVPGTYNVYFSAKDRSENECENIFNIVITVIDDIAPIIEGPTLYKSYLSSIIDTNTILSNLVITDNIDSLAHHNVYLIDDQYSKNIYTPGIYKLIVGCYDKSENESLPYIIEVNVIDNVAPIIDGTNEYISYVSTPITLTQIKLNLIALDNYDGNVINTLEITYDNYSNNKFNPGVYKISLIAKDSSENVSQQYIINIIVEDDIIPTIEGDNFYRTLTSEKIDTISLLFSLSAYDNIDGDISSNITLDTDNYSDNYSIPGTYFISFYVCDKSGNISNTFKIKIVVENDMSYIKSLNNSYLILDTITQKNDADILKIINIDQTLYSSIKTIENNYFNNYNIPGDYTIKYQITNTDNTYEYLTLNIKVQSTSQMNDISQTLVNEKKENIFSKISSFFKTMFTKIFNWLKNLFL